METDGKARRVLIVEDEMVVAMHLEDMLGDLGHKVIGLATRIDKALGLARQSDIDFAVLDINVSGQWSFAVADILRERAIPFIFATGYGAPGLVDGYRNELALRKPFEPHELEQAIARALADKPLR